MCFLHQEQIDRCKFVLFPQGNLRKIKGAYIVSVNGKCVLIKNYTIYALWQLCDEYAINLDIELALEQTLPPAATRKAVAEHNLFQPNESVDANYVHSLSVADLRSITQIRCLGRGFSEDTVTTNEIDMALGAIQSHVTPEEQAYGVSLTTAVCPVNNGIFCT